MSAEALDGGLVLMSADLCSKWGFGDGDEPDELLDMLGDAALPRPWHDVLADLVEEFLVPALKHDVETYRIETIHNPIRARSIDGRDIDEYVDAGWNHELTPQSVTVPWRVVLDRAGVR